MGYTPREFALSLMGKKEEPGSGGRQMPSHWGLRRANVVSHSAPVATQCSHASGIGLAIKMRGEKKVVMTSLGEGSTAQGEWYEAVNWAAIHKLPVVFLVENNGYAISETPDKQMAVPSAADKACGLGLSRRYSGRDGCICRSPGSQHEQSSGARSGDGPTLIEARMYRMTPHSSDDDDRTYRCREEVEEHKKKDPLIISRQVSGKRKTAHPAIAGRLETRARKWSMMPCNMPSRPPTLTWSKARTRFMLRRCIVAEITLIEALRQAMDEEMARDERVFITGEDVGKRGGVFRATIGLYEKYGAERVIDSPLAELSIVGVGIGAALYGMRPICEIQFADFIYPAFNQIVNEAARMCYRSNGEWTVPLTIRAPYGGGIGGGLYHSQSIEGFFAHIPGLKVVVPSTPYDAKGLLKSAVRDPNPVLYLEPKKGYRLI